jgi:ATP adenylyltransferase
LDQLWAGWRSEYVSTAVGIEGCVLCAITASDDVVWRGQLTAVVLNAYPYTSGHVMVAPLRHVADLEELSAAEAAELWGAVRDAVVALKAAYSPGGINVGLNLGKPAGAGVPGHLHVHALPRWEGDTNFMTAVAGVRVMPETLEDSRLKVRAAWPVPSVTP